MPVTSLSVINRPAVITAAVETDKPLVYMGMWDADLNDLGLISSSGTKGVTYKVSVAGNTVLDGITSWSVGDYCTFNGSTWDRLSGNEITLTAAAITDASAAGRAILTAADAAAQGTLLTSVVKRDATTQLQIGYTVNSHDLGTMTNFTADPKLGNTQYGTNNGGFTITAPADDGAVDILITNGSTAGTIVMSGFTAPTGGGGDVYALTNTYKFILMIRRIHGVSTFAFKALQA